MNPLYLQALTRYQVKPGVGKVPDMTGDIHAIAATRRPRLKPFFAERWMDWESLCGIRLKAVLALGWDEDRSGACLKCAERMRAIEYGAASATAQYTGTPRRTEGT